MPGARDEGLRRLADDLSDGIAVCRDGRIAWASRRLAEQVGRPAEDLAGMEPEALLERTPPGAGETVETRLRAAGGGVRTVEVTRREGPEPCQEIWTFRDVTRLRQLEAEVMSASRALRQVHLERERLGERLRRRAAELDEALTVVSHELRTPVTVVTGYARLLLSERVGPLNEEQRGFLEQSVRACQGMNAFIANLLERSRDEAGDAPLQVQEASLLPTVEGVVSALKPLLEEHRVEWDLDVEPPGPAARFDPLRIEQVIRNLLENAVKYAPPGGRVTVGIRTVEREGRREVEVHVSDQGPGVRPADRERIFDRYVRTGDTRSAGGLGLGLALCKRAVEAHGGVIGVTDAAGGGARFWFTLPAASSASA